MRTINQLMDLSGRAVLVTGAAGHLGQTFAQTLAELGCDVILADLSESVKDVASQIAEEYHVKAEGLALDLSDDQSVQGLCQTVLDRFERLDGLVNNAAFVGTSKLSGWAVPFEEQSTDAWRKAMDLNLTTPFLLSQMLAPALKKSGHGVIVNISSIYGVVAPQWSLYEQTKMANPAAYGASKAGLLQLTRYLSTTFAPDIRVNAITPGGIERAQPEPFFSRYNERTPLKRMAKEEDFKGALAYLISDLSAYVTGQNLVVDGGWTAW